ncbi:MULTISPECIES: transcription antitermination factor NusB [unclassified Phycicoccus]|uniref:transcription antitermination factor NusB n=1 Tax=unclassified Phycicoccus TaxID=2637926 RepID=UPI00070360BC|nr:MULTISPECIES: transcription antitermination factor NusB [unclassified Phycicoccus]KQU68482.1 N utilization substance protein B [Phycicoccus sp. Root101]KQZ87977.1 N utilization substance protein B [Phycicoccus sp. Root563]
MAARSKARKRAIDILFEAEQRGLNARDLLADRLAKPVTEAPLNQYTADLVEGVVSHWTDINELLSTYSQGWTIERMPSVDRAILRLGAYEILYTDDIPDGVAISEAVELATSLSTDDSPKFVNGLLGRLAEVKPTLA